MQKYESLAFFLKLIFTLSHTQAAVERLFSINKNVLSQNMKSETIIARKTIKDHMLFNNLKPETIEISVEFLQAARGAAQKWKLALEEQHKLKEKSEADKMSNFLRHQQTECKKQADEKDHRFA